MSEQESLEYWIECEKFAAVVEAAAEPYDPNITYLVGNVFEHEHEPQPQPQPQKKVSCLSIINQIVSGKAALQPPTLDLTKSKLFKDREARLKAAAAAKATIQVGQEVSI
jgi:hypothetical protein